MTPSSGAAPFKQISVIRPISGDFWQEFAVEFSFLMWSANLGIEIATAEKTRYLAQKIISYAIINEKTIPNDAKKLIKQIPRFLKYLQWALHSCIPLDNRKIGLLHLKQLSIYPTVFGEIGMVCSGFTEPIALELYYDLRNRASSYTQPAIMYIHAIFHSLLETQKSKLPDDFPKGVEIISGRKKGRRRERDD